MNIMRGDFSRLQRCTAIKTCTDETIPRAKPFKYTYEKEIVMYAYFKKLDYFSTECIYSPNAYRYVLFRSKTPRKERLELKSISDP